MYDNTIMETRKVYLSIITCSDAAFSICRIDFYKRS